MSPEPHRIERYLQATLGVSASLSRWAASGRLPLYLRDAYRFFESHILDVPCLLMVDLASEAPSPAKIRKHMEQIQSKWGGELVYVRDQVASYQRKRLIEQKVPFLVPGNQMYLPMLGIDLREHFRKQRETPPKLKPSTQALVLYLLHHRNAEMRTPVEFAEHLGYSKMTMSRAFDDLEGEELCKISKQGRERWLRLKSTRHELWSEASPLMRSPIKRRTHIRWTSHQPLGMVAGLSALATYSMLAAPRLSVVAVSSDDWKEISKDVGRTAVTDDDPDAVEVEVWNYDPKLFAKRRVVDRFSLFLSLRKSEDERVEAALDEMMETYEW